MSSSRSSEPRRRARAAGRGSARNGVRILVVALVGLAVPATLALARGRTTRHALAPATVSAAHNATLGETIVVDGRGRTLYWLSGDTTHHLECVSALCLKFWPPLTVASARTALRAGSGVHGKLGLFRRANGVEQVTLRGLLLYRFSGDKRAGTASGQGIASFGGVWRAVTATATSGAAAPSTPGAGSTPSSPTTPGGSPGSPGPTSSSTVTSMSSSTPGVNSAGSSSTSTATSTMTVGSQSTTTTTSTTSSYTYPYSY